MRLSAAPLWLALFASPLACGGRADIPPTPDLSALRRSYQEPTADLDDVAAVNALRMAPPMQELAGAFRAAGYVHSGVDQAGTTASAGAGKRLRLQGKLSVTLRCPGDTAEPVFDASENGSISLTIGVADTKIERAFGGTANHCVLRGEVLGLPVRVGIDGGLAFDMGRDLGLGDGFPEEFLAKIDGDIDVQGLTLSGLTARVTPERVEHLLELPDESTILIVLATDGLSVRGRNGTWLCTNPDSCASQ